MRAEWTDRLKAMCVGLLVCLTIIGTLAVVPATPAAASAAVQQSDPVTETWCGQPGTTSGFTGLSDAVLHNGAVTAGVWEAKQVAGVGGVPATGVEAVVLRVSMSSTATGYGTFAATGGAAPSAATLLYEPNDADAVTTVVVPLGTDGKIRWYFATTGSLSARLVGYFKSADAGGSYHSVSRYLVLNSSMAVGVPGTGSISGATVDAARGSSDVPNEGVGAVMAAIDVVAPAGTKVLAGRSASELQAIGTVTQAAIQLNTPVQVDSGSRFVVQLQNAGGQLVNGSITTSVLGYFAGGTSTYTALGVGGVRVAAVEVQANSPVAVPIAGTNGIPNRGISAAMVSVHFAPKAPATTLPVVPVGVWPAGDPIPVQALQSWYSSTETWETQAAPVALGDNGAIQLALRSNSGASLIAYVDVLGYFCDRDLPSPVTFTTNSHNATTWSSSQDLKVEWTPSVTADGPAGLGGYAVVVDDHAFTEPTPVVTHTAPHLETSVVKGRSWVHVRPVAADGTPGRTIHTPIQVQSDCSSLGESSYVPLGTPITYTSSTATNWTAIIQTQPWIPSNAVAVRLRVNAKAVTGSGWLSAYPGDQPLSAGVGQFVLDSNKEQSTEFPVAIGDHNGVPGAVLVSVGGQIWFQPIVVGYYVANPGLGYTALSASQRVNATPLQAPYTAVTSKVVNPSLRIDNSPSGIPTSGVSAVAATISTYGLGSTTNSYFMEAGPTGGAKTRLYQVRPGEAHATQAVIPLSAAGTFEYALTGSSAHVYVDVYGWYSAKGSEFHAIPEAQRRLANGVVLGPNSTTQVVVGGVSGIPAKGVTAVDGSLHVIPGASTTSNYLSVYPTGTTFDGTTAADLWDDTATTTAESHTIGLQATTGRAANNSIGFSIYNSSGTNNLSFDASGYYCRPTPTITSASHPDQARAYPTTTFNATWSVDDHPSAIAGYQVAWDTNPSFVFGAPAVTQTSNTFTSSAVAGTRFLYVRAIGTTGVPSETATYRIQTATAVADRTAGLGYEPWWDFVSRPVGPDATASVNVANGNLVVQNNDLPPIQAAGDLALSLRRTYNSLGSEATSLNSAPIGEGWNLAVAETEGAPLGLLAGSLTDLNPLAPVTMVDRDGTKHIYKATAGDLTVGPLSTTTGGLDPLRLEIDRLLGLQLGDLNLLGATKDLLANTTISAKLNDLGYGTVSGLAICADVRYSAPEGVHQALYRFVMIDIGTSSSTCSGLLATKDKAAVVGYVTVRPDRTTQLFTFDGRLASLHDGAGNRLDYEYELGIPPVGGRLKKISEPGTTRSLSFTWLKNALLEDVGLEVVDSTGRKVTYTTEVVAGHRLLTDVTITGPGTTGLLEQWKYRYNGQVTCGTASRLCEISAPRAVLGGPAATTPTQITYNPAGQVYEITEPGLLTYPPGTPAAAQVRPVTTFGYTSTETDVVRGLQATRYGGIDSFGRVTTVAKASPGQLATPLEETTRKWDDVDRPCTLLGDGGRANNLCETTRIGQSGDANRITRRTYNPEGNLVREVTPGDSTTGGDRVTTFGYQSFSYLPNGTSTVSDDAIIGPNGQMTGATRPANALYTVTQQVSSLTARGNASEDDWDDYLTTYTVDADRSKPVGTVGAGESCKTGNSGLVCRTDGVEETDTVNKYNDDGQLTFTQTAPNGPVEYEYLTGAADRGWIGAVKDATQQRVAFAYDTAGNVTAVWERAARARSDWSLTNLATATAYTYNSGATAAAGPWRWTSSETKPVTADDTSGHGARTTWKRDANGNPTETTPARGNAISPVSHAFDISGVYDGRDRKTSETTPAGTTTTSYDANGNVQTVIDGNTHPTGTTYDGAGRARFVYSTRIAPIDGCAPANTVQHNLPSVSSTTTVCSTERTYNAFGEVATDADASGLKKTNIYDRFGRLRLQTWPSTNGNQAATGTGYDLDGNKTTDCAVGAPVAVAEACASAGTTASALAPYVTATRYDRAGRAVETRYDRAPTNPAGAATGSSQPVITRTSYDQAGNVKSTTNANGAETTNEYDALGRLVAIVTPRAPGVTLRTERRFDPSGNVVAVLAPAATDELGTITYNGRKTNVTGYVYDLANRPTATVQAAQITNWTPNWANGTGYGIDGLVPDVPDATDPAARNVRTETHYGPDGQPVAVYAPRAFDAGRANPDEAWLSITEYDNAGRPATVWQPQALGTYTGSCPAKSTYTPAPKLPIGGPTLDPYASALALCQTTTGYDPVNNVTLTRSPGGKTVETDFDANNTPIAVTGPDPAEKLADPNDNNNTVTINTTYDPAGRVRTVSRPAANPEEGTWRETTNYINGLVTQRIGQRVGDGTLTDTTFTYDLAGRVVTELTVGDTAVSAAGANLQTNTVYMSDGLTASVTNPAGASAEVKTSYGYDPAGNPTKVSSPNANASGSTTPWPTAQFFSLDNQLLETREPIELAAGKLKVRRTVLDLDPSGRKTLETATTATLTDANSTSAVSSSTPAARTARYLYQAAGWLAGEYDGAAAAPQPGITYLHNLDGTLANAKDNTTTGAPVAINATWQLDGRPTAAITTVGDDPFSTVTGTWRPDGERASQAVSTYGQNETPPGQLERRSWQTATQTWQHNAAGLVDGSTATFADGTSQTANFTWTHAATQATGTYGGITETRTSEPDGMLAKVQYAGPNTNLEQTYTYDGARRQRTHNVVGINSRTYTYDNAGRILNDGGAITWDPSSNRLTAPSTNSTYRADNSLKTTTGAAAEVKYDNAGRQLNPDPADLSCEYRYDFLNRTTAVAQALDPVTSLPIGNCANKAAYLNDPMSRQIIDLEGAAADRSQLANDLATGTLGVDEIDETHTIFDLLGNDVVATTGSNTIGASSKTDRTDYAATSEGPWALRSMANSGAVGTQWLLSDGHGSVAAVRDSSGIACKRIYDTFGGSDTGTTCTDSLTSNQLWYRGGKQDKTFKTYQYGARRYDPKTASWTTPDSARPGSPIEDLSISTDPLTANRYTYVNGDPVNLADPSGHFACCSIKKLVARARAAQEKKKPFTVPAFSSGCEEGAFFYDGDCKWKHARGSRWDWFSIPDHVPSFIPIVGGKEFHANIAERRWCARHPKDCSRVAGARASAIMFANETTGRGDGYGDYAQGGPPDGTLGNAYQHAAWAMSLSLEFGEEKAREILERHELIQNDANGPVDRRKRQMDWANNEYGLMVARELRDEHGDVMAAAHPSEGHDLIKELGESGQLCYLNDPEGPSPQYSNRRRCGM